MNDIFKKESSKKYWLTMAGLLILLWIANEICGAVLKANTNNMALTPQQIAQMDSIRNSVINPTAQQSAGPQPISNFVPDSVQTPVLQTSSTPKEQDVIQNDNLYNTYRDARLLMQINYPRNWQITDYVNYDKNGGGKGTSFLIASLPTPSEGWSVANPPPTDYNSVSVSVLPNGTVFKNEYDNQDNVYLKEKTEIEVSKGNNLEILVYGAKDQSKDDMELPQAIAYYYGDNYLYEFSIPGWGPNTNEQISIFKQILSSFKEIK